MHYNVRFLPSNALDSLRWKIHKALIYVLGFQVEDVTEASKLGMILSLVVTNDVQQNIESVDSVVGQLATIHRYHSYIT